MQQKKPTLIIARKGQAALEYMMTYGLALVGIAVVVGAIFILTGQSTSYPICQMSPSSGAVTYHNHSVTGGAISLILQNDSGKTISDVNVTYSGDFKLAASKLSQGPYTSAQEFLISTTGSGLTSGTSYSGTVAIQYKRNNVVHVSTAICTGTAN